MKDLKEKSWIKYPGVVAALTVSFGITSSADAADRPTGHALAHTIAHGSLPPPPSQLDLDYDVLAYRVSMDIRTASDSYDATVGILVAATRDGTEQLVLDVGREHTEGDVTFNPYDVVSVRGVFGQPLDSTQDTEAGTLTVRLDSALDEGRLTWLVVEYGGGFNPFTTGPYANVGMLRSEGLYGNDIVQTFGWPGHARRWLPSHDTPADPAVWFATVRIDNDDTLISNGRVLSRRTSGTVGGQTSTASFAMFRPVPTYAMQIVAGDFVHLSFRDEEDGIPIDAYVYPEDEEAALATWGDIPAAFDHVTERLGPYEFSKYTMVEVPSTFGGMEHATIVSIADTSVAAGDALDVGIHELTHHWVGDNLYQSEWPAFWLNESLATFITADTLGFLQGEDAFTRDLLDRRDLVFAVPQFFNDDALHFQQGEVPFEVTSASAFAPYYKGPWIWEMLRYELGDDLLWDFLFDYIQDNQFSPYDTEHVREALNAYTDTDYGPFFDEWVYEAGWPQITTEISGDTTPTLTVQQVQDGDAFGTYTFEGGLALQFELDDDDASTPSCAATVTFSGGSVSQSVSPPCGITPTIATLVNGDRLFVEQL